MVMVWSSWRYFRAMKLRAVVSTKAMDRKICWPGFFDLSDGLKAKGQSTIRLKSTWAINRSQVTWPAPIPLVVTRYLAVVSSTAKATVAAAISPIASSRFKDSTGAV